MREIIESDQPWKQSWGRSFCFSDSSPHCLRPHPFSFAHLSLLLSSGKRRPCPAAFLELREEKFIVDVISRKSDTVFDKNNLPRGEPVLLLATSTSVPSAACFISSFKIYAGELLAKR